MVLVERLTEDDLQAIVAEASSARRRVGGGSVADSLRDLHVSLLDCRRSLDRLDEVLSRMVLARGHAVALAARAKADHEDAIMEIVNGPRSRVRFPEYASASERTALISLAARDSLNVMREADAYALELNTVLDYVRSCHRGVDTVRRDIETRIRIVSLESTLER